LSSFVARLAHPPGQHTWPEAQVTPQPPQEEASVKFAHAPEQQP